MNNWEKQAHEHFSKVWDTPPETGTKDLRGRVITFANGKRVFHLPTKKIEDCFAVETISWTFAGTNKNGQQTDFKTASGNRERDFRRDNKHLFTFS
jgi:hypothetical protein